MIRRKPLKTKREEPRRNEGRISHERMKPRAKRSATAQERRHLARVAEMDCLVAGCNQRPQVHHVVSDGLKRIQRTHERVVPLCREHHLDGPCAVHRVGHARFAEIFGLDLLQISIWLWEESSNGEVD